MLFILWSLGYLKQNKFSGLRNSYSWIFLITQLQRVFRLSGASCLFRFIKTITFSRQKRRNIGFPGGSDGKESACNLGDLGSIPSLERSRGGGHGDTLQYSCLGNLTDSGAWWATAHKVAKGQTQLKQLSAHSTYTGLFHNSFRI